MALHTPLAFENTADGLAVLRFDETLYPQEAVFAAAYSLLDRAWVHISRADGQLEVQLRPKSSVPLSAEHLAGEFESEALSQTWRIEIFKQNRSVIESITSCALSSAAGVPDLDDLLDQDLGLGDPLDDPLGIAVPWEDKYGPGTGQAAPPDDNSGGRQQS